MMQTAEVWVSDNRLRSGAAADGVTPVTVRQAAEMLLGAPDGQRCTVDAQGVNLQILRLPLEVGGRVKVNSLGAR